MIGCVLFAAGAVAIVVAAASSHLGLIPVPVALAGLVLIGGARWMPARTAQGTELARLLLGFRRYLTTAAAGQARPAGQAACSTTTCPTRSCSGAPSSGLLSPRL